MQGLDQPYSNSQRSEYFVFGTYSEKWDFFLKKQVEITSPLFFSAINANAFKYQIRHALA